jgi:excisionase family DNA binding protein
MLTIHIYFNIFSFIFIYALTYNFRVHIIGIEKGGCRMAQLMNIKQMAERLNVSDQKIRSMCRNKQIPFIRLGDGPSAEYRFDPEIIDAWIRGKVIEDSGFAPAEPPRRGRPPKAKEPE